MGAMGELFDILINRIKEIVNEDIERDEKLKKVCKLLRDDIPHYDWVGFYMVNKDNDEELALGPFEGEPTEHVSISFGEGICGQAAEKRDTFIVQDVSLEPNYLSCNPDVKSEIVIPIEKSGEIVGELDIDSHSEAPFTRIDRQFLEEVCEIVEVLF